MKNILPELKTFSLREAKENQALQWHPAESLPAKLSQKSVLKGAFSTSEISKQAVQAMTAINKRSQLAPNERYLSALPIYGISNPSPICEEKR
jgi:hypothetical protein